jgi:CheY-like chemotaxis protein
MQKEPIDRAGAKPGIGLSLGGRDVVLIAVTGWGEESDRLRSREAGFDHHLVKPVDIGGLMQLLERVERDGAVGGGRAADA